MHAWLYRGSSIALGIVVGLAATLGVLDRPGMPGTVSAGAWHTSTSTGSPDAGPYIRARVARRGLLALSGKETLYYSAGTDSDGQPLSGNCDYRLRGKDLPARWWSITAYGADNFLIPNEAGRYSLSQTSVRRLPSRQWVIDIGATPAGYNWLPVRTGEPFDLTMRLYNPEPSVHEAPAQLAMPVIERVGCL